MLKQYGSPHHNNLFIAIGIRYHFRKITSEASCDENDIVVDDDRQTTLQGTNMTKTHCICVIAEKVLLHTPSPTYLIAFCSFVHSKHEAHAYLPFQIG